MQIIWWSTISSEYAGELDAHADIFGGEEGKQRRADFKLRVIEHNILVVCKYYRRITLQRLGQILDLSQDEVRPARQGGALAGNERHALAL